MDLIFQIIGMLVLGGIGFLVVAGVVAFLLFRSRIARFLMEAQGAEGIGPTRIHLNPPDRVDWHDADRVAGCVRELEALGFAWAGSWKIDELPVQMTGLVHGELGLFGVVYEHEEVGVWCDVVAEFDDGGSLTVGNPKQGGELDPRPRHEKIIDPEMTPRELFDRARQAITQRRVRPATASEFAARVEQAWADEMDWRLARGGVTEDEVRRIADGMQESFEGQDLRDAHAGIGSGVAFQIEEACLDHFLRESEISAVDWEKFRDRILVIHDRLDAATVFDLVVGEVEMPGDLYEREQERGAMGVSARQYFENLNESLPSDQRFLLLGDVEEPVPADVYAGPYAGTRASAHRWGGK